MILAIEALAQQRFAKVLKASKIASTGIFTRIAVTRDYDIGRDLII